MIGMLRFHNSMSREDMVNTLNSNFGEMENDHNKLAKSKKRIYTSGAIDNVGSKINIDLDNIRLVLEYDTATDSKLGIQAIDNEINVDVSHKQITDTTVTSVSVDDQTYTTLTNLVATIANDSNGITETLIRDISTGRIWEVKTLISGNGSRASLWAELVI